MKTTINYGFGKPKLSLRAKATAALMLFPWSLLLIPAAKLGDMIAHAFGGCIGH